MDDTQCPICKKICDEELTTYVPQPGVIKKRCRECYRTALSEACEKMGMKFVKGFEIKIGGNMKSTKETDMNRIQELGQDLEDLCETYNDLPVYEVGVRLIAQATRMLFCCAPNQIVAIQTILAAIDIGISEYKENHENQKGK